LVAVGLNPEDGNFTLHALAAVITIVIGDVALPLTAMTLLRAKWKRSGRLGLVLAAVGILSFIPGAAQVGGPGLSGMRERIAAFPLLLGVITYGVLFAVKPFGVRGRGEQPELSGSPAAGRP
jgi:hypothetical protein